MEILKRKGFVQKIIITLIVLIMFNFIVPSYSMAAFGWGWGGGSLAGPICEFVCWVGDSIIYWLQKGFLPNSHDMVIKARPIDLKIQILENRNTDLQDNKLREAKTREEKEKIIEEINKNEQKIAEYKIKKAEYDSFSAWTHRNTRFLSRDPISLAKAELEEEQEIADGLQEQELVYIFYGPLTIFSNLVPALDVNFINPILSYRGVKDVNLGLSPDGKNVYVESYVMNEPSNTQDSTNIAASIQGTIATWYNALRNLAIVFLLSVLIYIAIRIILSSAAGETAKYKSMLKDWLIALCILFFMHYFMAFLLKSTEMIIQFLTTNTSNEMYVDGFMSELRNKIPYEKDSIVQWADTVMYFTLVCYTLMFTWRYLKRVVYLAFLTVISPLVAFTYPIDKIKDGSAQAFNKWFKEYLFNILIQPVHLLLYTVLITSAKDLAHTNILYSLVALGFMLEAEKIVKDFFGLSAQRGESTGAAITGGAMFAATVGLVQKGLGFLPEGDGGKGDKSKPRHNTRDSDSKAKKSVEDAWIEENQNNTNNTIKIDTNNVKEGDIPFSYSIQNITDENGRQQSPEVQFANLRNNGERSREILNQIQSDTSEQTSTVNNVHNTQTNSSQSASNQTNSTEINEGQPNRFGTSIPGNINQATIQNATIQNATINQGASLQGQISSRTGQTGVQRGEQANGQLGVQQLNAHTGGQIPNGPYGGIQQLLNPYEDAENAKNEEIKGESTLSSKNKKKKNEGPSIRRGLEFVVRENLGRDSRRKMAKKALRLGLMGAGAAAFGTMGLGAGLAGNGTDDVVKYTGMGLGLGAMAGKKAYNLGGSTIQMGKDTIETYNEGYYGKDYQDAYYGPKLDEEYEKDPEVIKHYKMYYGGDWRNSIKQAIELRKMGITNQDDIDIALLKIKAKNPQLNLPQVASLMKFYKQYSEKDLRDPKHQRYIYNDALEMTKNNRQKSEEIVNMVLKSKGVTLHFKAPSDDTEENS